MPRWVFRFLLALNVVLVATMPMSACAMSMSMSDGMGTMVAKPDCRICPPAVHTGGSSGTMVDCHALACPNVVIALPDVTQLPGRVWRVISYSTPAFVRWTAAPRTLDPFPPKPVALVQTAAA